MITQSLVTVGIFLALLVCLPFALKWIKQRVPGNQAEAHAQLRFISALAVGQHQRVVTVEVGPEGRRVWLTLGVTAQSISYLHSIEIAAESHPHQGQPAEPVGIQSANYGGTSRVGDIA
ncbi:MAG: flagellar biosynthetic protein FliO [Pseudomonadota bacterium]